MLDHSGPLTAFNSTNYRTCHYVAFVYLECNGLIGLSSKEEILPLPVWWLHLLLVGGHEPVPGLDSLGDLGVVHFEHERLLSRFRAPLLGHPIARSADLDKLLDVHTGLLWGGLLWCVFGLLGRSPPEVALMLLALKLWNIMMRNFVTV